MTRRFAWPAATLVALASAQALKAAAPDLKSGIDKATFDPAVRPQDDLYRHVNGKWLKEAQIPADRPFDGAFFGLRDKAEAHLRAIIEEAAAKSDKPDKVGDLYAAFMDEAKAEELGIRPIQPELDRIAAIQDKVALIPAMAELQKAGVPGIVAGFVSTDAKQSDRYILYLNQSGLGLPDESYYRDPKFQKVRDAYLAHMGLMFALAKLPDPEGSASRVMTLETALAKGHWDRVRSRDATKAYNKRTVSELKALAPELDPAGWIEAMGAKGVEEVVVRQPSYLSAASAAVAAMPLEDWKLYLAWNVLRDRAPLLSKAFVEENFNFYGKTLTGAPELRVRWKRGVAAVEGALGEAAGQLYVAKHFPPQAKVRMEALVKNLIAAYREDIQALDWMSPETKARALDKLAKFSPKVGYPNKWRDYSGLEIQRDDLVGNNRRSAAFELAYNFGKLGKPIDREEWGMTPQTVNAYYNPGKNEIVFPAAILQPPFFDMDADDAVNYGGIGAVIGHEVGHGFDDQGSKFDGDGNLKDWWTAEDRAEFDKRAKALIAQYDGFEPAQLPGQHVNGALTIGENIGDLGGLTIAHKAYLISLEGKDAPVIDGLSGPQRLFLGWAQVWRAKYRDAELSRRIATDPHSPTEFRCNGVVRNLKEFHDAFGLKEGDKLYLAPEQRVRIW